VIKEKSLHQIMNEIAGRIDTLQPSFAGEKDEFGHFKPTDKQQAQLRGDKDALSEVEAFMQLDPLLAQLHKQFLEAKIYRKELSAANGPNDPMTEVALDMEDSAYCAFQTRYIELRQVRDMMARAQRLMRDSAEDAEREKNKEREQEFKNFLMMAKMQDRVNEQNRQGGFEYAILLLIFNLVPMPNYQLKPQSYQRMAA